MTDVDRLREAAQAVSDKARVVVDHRRPTRPRWVVGDAEFSALRAALEATPVADEAEERREYAHAQGYHAGNADNRCQFCVAAPVADEAGLRAALGSVTALILDHTYGDDRTSLTAAMDVIKARLARPAPAEVGLDWRVVSTSALDVPTHAFRGQLMQALCGAGPALGSSRPDDRRCRRCAALSPEPPEGQDPVDTVRDVVAGIAERTGVMSEAEFKEAFDRGRDASPERDDGYVRADVEAGR